MTEWIVPRDDHSDAIVRKACMEGAFDWTDRMCLFEKGAMHYLYVDEGLRNREIFEYLSERVDQPITQQDVNMSLRWHGYILSSKPLQAQGRPLHSYLSFGWELEA